MGIIDKARKKSPWIIHYDCTSCNGCDIETLACLTPLYDVERFGIINVGNPKHADVLVVTGSVNKRNVRVLKNLYNQMPDPKAVVAVGACACTGGIFSDCYNVYGGVNKVLPVDVYVPGCCPRPEAIIDGIVQAMDKLEGKARNMKHAASGKQPEAALQASTGNNNDGANT
ncbi:MAG: NADH-quinone oxidoreductase subunit B family protein [Bacillota bacterium]|nr:NADH-quinone oxidoreductase subunit B family protein [Bacillota bacterium]